jgi:hypothetical protein
MEPIGPPLKVKRHFKLLLYVLLLLFARIAATSPSDLAIAPVQPLAKRQQFSYELSEEFTALKELSSAALRPPSTEKPVYELANLALLSAVDGSVFAVNRQTGRWIWTLHSNEATVLSPLVASQTNVTPSAYSAGLLTSKPPELPLPGDQQEATPDEVYVVEPTAGGSIYLHVKSSGTTQKLPLTIAELVDLSPFTFPSDDSRMFVGKRTTSLVGVDLASGKLVGVFGPEAGWCEWNGKQGIAKDEECEEGIQSRPRDMLYLGRTGAFRAGVLPV